MMALSGLSGPTDSQGRAKTMTNDELASELTPPQPDTADYAAEAYANDARDIAYEWISNQPRISYAAYALARSVWDAAYEWGKTHAHEYNTPDDVPGQNSLIAKRMRAIARRRGSSIVR